MSRNDHVLIQARHLKVPYEWKPKLRKDLTREQMQQSLKNHQVGVIRQKIPSEWTLSKPPITSSSIRDWEKCRRYYLLKDRLQLKRRSQYNEALSLGTLFHKICEWILLGDTVDNATDRLLAKAESERELWNSARVAGMAWAYFNLWQPVPIGWEIVDVEQRVTVSMGRGIRPLSAKFDVIVRDPSNGHLWIDDHKTTRGDPMGIVPALLFDTQTYHYKVCADAKYPGEAVAGIIHNIIQKCMIKPQSRGNTEETPPEFAERIRDWYCDKAGYDPRKGEEPPKVSPPTQPIIRSSVFFGGNPPVEYKELLREVSRMSNCSPIPERFPRCHDMYTCTGHGTPCEFLEVCRHSDPDKMFNVLAEHYEQEDAWERIYGEES